MKGLGCFIWNLSCSQCFLHSLMDMGSFLGSLFPFSLRPSWRQVAEVKGMEKARSGGLRLCGFDVLGLWGFGSGAVHLSAVKRPICLIGPAKK